MIRTFFTLALTFMTILNFGKNVGIGTSTPQYRLTDASEFNGKGIVQTNADVVSVGFMTLASGVYLNTFSNHPLHLSINSSLPGLTLATKNNFGIGRYTPSEKLQVEGNVHVNGNMGLGISPTTQLDVAGTIRFRNSFPKKGSMLTSNDASGNASWKDPVAFSVSGLYGGTNQVVNENVWTKVTFSTSTNYNLGLSCQPVQSQFQAPENGIYSFNAQVTYDFSYRNVGFSGLRLILNRNGAISAITETSNGQPYVSSGYATYNNIIQTLSTDV